MGLLFIVALLAAGHAGSGAKISGTTPDQRQYSVSFANSGAGWCQRTSLHAASGAGFASDSCFGNGLVRRVAYLADCGEGTTVVATVQRKGVSGSARNGQGRQALLKAPLKHKAGLGLALRGRQRTRISFRRDSRLLWTADVPAARTLCSAGGVTAGPGDFVSGELVANSS
jgi:hypothetical protein